MKKAFAFIFTILMIFILPSCSEESEGIGRIITHEDFVREFSKRVNLEDYDLEQKDHTSFSDYTYTAKDECEIAQSKSNLEVDIDGIKIALPLKVKELVDLGFVLVSDSDSNVPLSYPYYDKYATLNVRTPKGNVFQIFAISEDDDPASHNDLTIAQINWHYDQDNGERVPDIKFFEKVSGDLTIDDIVRELKVPQTIRFTQATHDGKPSLADIQLSFNFSDEKHGGSVTITTHSILDKKIKKTSFISAISYVIDHESIKNN